MRLEFEPRAFADLQHWVTTDARLARKALKLIEETKRDPFGGSGKSETLKNELSGWWSKRIDGEHRLVCRMHEDCLIIAEARGHYDD